MIVPARVRKVAGDLTASKARSALVVLSIAVGVAAVGTVAGARALMADSLEAASEEAVFPSATLLTDPLDDATLARLSRVPGVEALEARRVVGARLDARGERRELTLTAAPSYERMRLARVLPERGAWPPPEGRLLLERDSLVYAGLEVGDEVALTLPGGKRGRVVVAGTVHDLTPPSATTSGILYGYVTPATLRRLGDAQGPNQLHLAAAGDARRVTAAVRAKVERSGRAVLATTVPEAGRFWAHDQVDAMVLLLSVLGVVSLLMSGFLVANSVSALVAQQIRQIGVLKAVGASASDTAAVYLATALVLGTLALAVAVPLGAVAALVLVDYSAGLINLNPPPFRVPLEVVALQVAAGLLVPLAAAIGPVLAGSRVTVREAVASQGIGGAGAGVLVARLAAGAPRISPSLRLSLANALRRPRRLALTLTALVLAGTALLAVLSVRSSLAQTLDDGARYRAWDAELTLDRAASPAALERAASATPGVVRAEAWPVAAAHRLRPGGVPGDTFTVLGAPPQTELIRPLLLEGRWVRPGETGALVVNDELAADEPDLRVGGEATIALDGRRGRWRVVGVVRGVLEGPLAYVPAAALGDARRLLAATARHDEAGQRDAARALAGRLEQARFPVASIRTAAERRALDEENFGVLVSFLLTMAALLGIVGGLGLAGALGLGVIERTREIGVLRAIGAGNGAVVRLVLAEGAAVAAIGGLLAIPLAVPAGNALADAVGELFLGGPLTYAFATWGAVLWLVLALAVAVVAGLVPALRAARLPIRDLVAYE